MKEPTIYWKKRNPLFTIHEQGAPEVCNAYVYKRSDDIAVIYVDMKTKNCEVACIVGNIDNTNGVAVQVTEGSWQFDKRRKDKFGYKDTTILFKGFDYDKGWRIACSQCSRYTLTVVLIKD